MNLTADDYNILYYLLLSNKFSYERVVNWSYSKYTDEGIDPFIEKIALSCDPDEVYDLITTTYGVNGQPSDEFLIGEIASDFYNGKIGIATAIRTILFHLEVSFSKEDEKALYLAEDVLDWHEQPAKEALKHIASYLKKHQIIYENAVSKFKT